MFATHLCQMAHCMHSTSHVHHDFLPSAHAPDSSVSHQTFAEQHREDVKLSMLPRIHHGRRVLRR